MKKIKKIGILASYNGSGFETIQNAINDGILDEEEIYDMKPKNTDLKCEIIAMTLSAFGSFSIYVFYILFILISVVIRFM